MTSPYVANSPPPSPDSKRTFNLGMQKPTTLGMTSPYVANSPPPSPDRKRTFNLGMQKPTTVAWPENIPATMTYKQRRNYNAINFK